MEILLYRVNAVSSTAWSVKGDDLEWYIVFKLVFSWKFGFSFVVQVMNKSFSYRNPFKALLAALESETIGMVKYDKLKERVRDIGVWNKL